MGHGDIMQLLAPSESWFVAFVALIGRGSEFVCHIEGSDSKYFTLRAGTHGPISSHCVLINLLLQISHGKSPLLQWYLPPLSLIFLRLHPAIMLQLAKIRIKISTLVCLLSLLCNELWLIYHSMLAAKLCFEQLIFHVCLLIRNFINSLLFLGLAHGGRLV